MMLPKKVALLLPVIVFSLPFLHRQWDAINQRRSHILPYNHNETMIKSSDDNESIIRQLGYAKNDVTLWNSEYKNGSYLIRVQINKSFTGQAEKKIRTALKSIEKRSKVIKFRISSLPPKKTKPYIHIKQTGSGCWSWIGRTSSAKTGQVLSLDEDENCVTSAIIEHEILHALGLIHEHTREDRDSYVEIKYDNIREGREGSFNIDKNGDTLGTEYDLNSVMHYGKKSSAKNDNVKTIVAKVSFKKT